jgi:hypothetical protein
MKDQDAQMFEYTSWMTKHGGFARDMTMRDHFAAKAMQGVTANPDSGVTSTGLAERAYKIADAMLSERAK